MEDSIKLIHNCVKERRMNILEHFEILKLKNSEKALINEQINKQVMFN